MRLGRFVFNSLAWNGTLNTHLLPTIMLVDVYPNEFIGIRFCFI